MNTIIVSSKGRVRRVFPLQRTALSRAALKLKAIPILALDQVEKRLEICQACDAPGRFDEHGQLAGCSACGCGVQIARAIWQWPRFEGQWCPLNRWPTLAFKEANA